MQKDQMVKHETLSLYERYHTLGKDFIDNLTTSFKCPVNSGVERFFRHNAVNSCLSGITQTHYILSSIDDEFFLSAFFTLANKVVTINHSNVSTTFFKKY
jgi:hypothetical protein